MSNTFTNTIFKDIFCSEIKDNMSQQNIIETLSRINYLYTHTYKKIETNELDEAVMIFGDYVYSILPKFINLFEQFDIFNRYFYLIKKDDEKFSLILETLNKKEKEEVYSLLDAIKKIPANKSLDFVLDGRPREVDIPYIEAKDENEDAKLLYKVIASYIVLLLRKEECIMSIVVHKDNTSILIGILISKGKWLPLKKDYMRAIHTQTLKKMGEETPKNIKYGEIKKKITKFS